MICTIMFILCLNILKVFKASSFYKNSENPFNLRNEIALLFATRISKLISYYFSFSVKLNKCMLKDCLYNLL